MCVAREVSKARRARKMRWKWVHEMSTEVIARGLVIFLMKVLGREIKVLVVKLTFLSWLESSVCCKR